MSHRNIKAELNDKIVLLGFLYLMHNSKSSRLVPNTTTWLSSQPLDDHKSIVSVKEERFTAPLVL
ncbi:hypothetical protein [Halobacillus litoralis]|uniref:hypothetical protein n=1 Tax=Halobacillus litoralis TaxID=45668 RepID=UPI0024924BDE|nr:hypothetical protein [Halobacillus litoralis]